MASICGESDTSQTPDIGAQQTWERSRGQGNSQMRRERPRGLTAAALAAIIAVGPVALSAAGSAPAANAAAHSATITMRASGSVWQPPADADWQWELGKPLVTTNANLMGTGITAYNGDTAPGDNPTVYDIDAIENPASTVAALHQLGDHAICYIEVGTAGN